MSAKPLNVAPLASTTLVLVFSLWLGGCAATGSIPSEAEPGGKPLACPLPSNCVNSMPGSGLDPLRFDGTAPEAMDALKATLAAFPEARIVKTGALTVEAVFTTTVGFQDRVDFLFDAPRQRIDYRSRSLLGLYDFGKNRSRMEVFAQRFEQVRAR